MLECFQNFLKYGKLHYFNTKVFCQTLQFKELNDNTLNKNNLQKLLYAHQLRYVTKIEPC